MCNFISRNHLKIRSTVSNIRDHASDGYIVYSIEALLLDSAIFKPPSVLRTEMYVPIVQYLFMYFLRSSFSLSLQVSYCGLRLVARLNILVSKLAKSRGRLDVSCHQMWGRSQTASYQLSKGCCMRQQDGEFEMLSSIQMPPQWTQFPSIGTHVPHTFL